MKHVIPFAAALFLTTSWVSAGHAQGDVQQNHGRGEAVRAACHDDIAKLCGDLADGRGTFRCLREHEDAVSDTCKSALSTARAQHQGHGGWSGSGGAHG